MTPVKTQETEVETATDTAQRPQGRGTRTGPRERRPSPQDLGNRKGKSHTGAQTTGDMTADRIAEGPNAKLTMRELYANLESRLEEVSQAEGELAAGRWVTVGQTLMEIYIREKNSEDVDTRKSQQHIAELFEQHGLVKENLLRLNLLIRCSNQVLASKREKDGLRNGINLLHADGSTVAFTLESEAGIAALKTLGRSMTAVYNQFATHINAVAGPRNRGKQIATLEEVADTPEVIKHRVQNVDGTYESKSFAENKPASMRLVIGLCRLWGPKLTQEERDEFVTKIEETLNAKPAFVPQPAKDAKQDRKSA